MLEEVGVRVTLLPGGQMPSYGSSEAAGMDLRCRESFELKPLERKLVPTGIKIAIPVGYEGQVRPRSGLAMKLGLSLVNTPGTIDSDYRGEVGVLLINLGSDVVTILQGERIAQLVVCPIVRARLEQVEEAVLDRTERGEGGFGSTGTR